MPSVYRCTCGKAYNLEEGKKYKCKNCGAVMQLGEQAPVASAAPEKANASKAPSHPSPRNAAGATPSTRPGSAKAGSPRPSLRSRQTESSEPPAKKSNTGMMIGIGIGAAVLIGAIFFFMGGGEEARKAEEAKIAQAKKAEEEKKAAEAAAVAAKAKPKEKKKLTKEEFEGIVAQIKRGDENKDMNALQGILQKIKDENIEIDRTPLHKAILRINPQDPQVTAGIGLLDRNKLNYDEMDARYKRAEKAKDVKALYDVIRWVFENNLYSTSQFGLDYIIVYKAILRIDPEDYEARVAGLKVKDPRKAPYTGPAQEFKGKLLHADEFMAAKEIEWKLHKETGTPFLPTEGGGSKAQ